MPLHALGAVEYFTIAAYLLLMVIVGWRFRSSNRTAGDYFRSGSRGTWWLVGASVFMSSFSTWTFTGGAGVAFEAGWSVLIIPISNIAGFVVNFIWTGPWFRQLRATTGPEVVRLRYGPVTQQFYAIANIGMGLLMAALHLFGMAIFCSSVFGMPLDWAIVLIGVIVLVYSTSGGNWAVMATDFLQGLILIPVTMLVAWLAWRAIGGWSGLHQAIVAQHLQNSFRMVKPTAAAGALGAFTMGWTAAMILKNTVTWNTLVSAPRFFTVKDGREARKAALFCTVAMTLGAVLWYLPPIVARLRFAEAVRAVPLGKPAESAYAVASMMLLPPGMIGLVVVAMTTATMSSMSYGLNHVAAIVITDIYPSCCRALGRTPKDETQLLGAGRLVSFGLGILILAIAICYARQKGTGVFEQMLNVGAYLGTPMAIPMFLGLFIRRTPSWAALVSTAAALAASACAGLSPLLGGGAWKFQSIVFLNLGVGSGVFLLSMIFWSRTPTSYRLQVRRFFERMHTPVDFEREVGGATDLSQLRQVGGLAFLIGCLVLILLGFAASAAARCQILFVAACLIIVGAVMWRVGRRRSAAPGQ